MKTLGLLVCRMATALRPKGGASGRSASACPALPLELAGTQIGCSCTIRSAGIGWRFHICFMKSAGRIAALIAQITLPIRLHLAGVSRTGLTTNCDPIDPAPKPRSQIKWPKQWRNG